jgi:hypothetical protein
MNDRNLARRLDLTQRLYVRTPHVHRERRHKFSVGQIVGLTWTAGLKRPRETEGDLLDTRFEITKLLPHEDRSFQYRVRDARTGHERIVAEENIVARE